MIRQARRHESALISSLAIRSKRHWGYDEPQMRIFAGELTLTPDDIESRPVYVLETEAGDLVGFFALADRTPGDGVRLGLDERQSQDWLSDAIELEHLFVDPDQLRMGHGRRLLASALRVAARTGARFLIVQSDPDAAGFYEANGFDRLHEIPSSIPGRALPLFRCPLEPPPHSSPT